MDLLTHDATAVETFLTALYPDLPEDLHLLIWSLDRNTEKKCSYWPTTVEAAIPLITSLPHPGIDIYFGVGLTDQVNLTQHQRASAEQIVAIPGVWADIDIAGPGHAETKGYPPSVEEALSIIEALPLRPSLIVHSGGGLHVYWLFTELWRFETAEEHNLAAGMVYGWQGLLRRQLQRHGWGLGSTHDLARVLRVPGTYNWKTGDVHPVTILRNEPVRYNNSELDEWAQPLPASDETRSALPFFFPPESALEDGKVRETIDLLREFSVKFKATWDRKRPDLHDQSASGYDMALAALAVREGVRSVEMLSNLLVAYRRKDGLPIKHQGYFALTISKALKNASVTSETPQKGALVPIEIYQCVEELSACPERLASVCAELTEDDRRGLLKTINGLDGRNKEYRELKQTAKPLWSALPPEQLTYDGVANHIVQRNDEGKAYIAQTRRINDISADLYRLGGGWPKVAGNQLFYDADGKIRLLPKSEDLFAWMNV